MVLAAESFLSLPLLRIRTSTILTFGKDQMKHCSEQKSGRQLGEAINYGWDADEAGFCCHLLHLSETGLAGWTQEWDSTSPSPPERE